MSLRPYQRESLDALYGVWRSNTYKHPLIVAPPASGKGTIIAAFCKEAMQAYPNTRIGVFTHVRELVDQNYKRLKGGPGQPPIWADAPAGICSAGLKKFEPHAPIIFGGIQTCADKSDLLGKFDVILIDEAHLVSRNDSSQYQKFLAACFEKNPHLKVVGLTATEYRMDSGYLTDDFRDTKALFDGIAYNIGIDRLLNEGWISPLVTRGTVERLSTSDVATRGGEFVPGALAGAVDRAGLNRAIAKEIVEAGRDRHSWKVFCTGVDHAFHVRDELRALGVHAETITGSTSDTERETFLQMFKAGDIRALTSANALTTGVDAPCIDLIALLRPTLSPGLLVQQLGRGFRLSPETAKRNCVVLDFAGNTMRHGPVDRIRGPDKSGSGAPGMAPAKECPNCRAIVHTSVLTCVCGHQWPPPDRLAKLEARASEDAIMSGASKPAWWSVRTVEYESHQREGYAPALMIIYHLGPGTIVREWVNVEGHGSRRRRAEEWWRLRSIAPLPADVRTCLHLSDDLKIPKRVMIQKVGKFFEIVAIDFGGKPSFAELAADV